MMDIRNVEHLVKKITLDSIDALQLSSKPSSSTLNASKLQSELSGTIKQCKHYIGKGEIATDKDLNIVYLCFLLEQILSHGLRSKVSFSSNSENIQSLLEFLREFNLTSKNKLDFWNCISFILPRQERERCLSLKFICTDVGRGRAWLRSALNERSLERYLKCLFCETEVLEQFYDSGAFLRDKEKCGDLLKSVTDISSIVFAINTDNPDLNNITEDYFTFVNNFIEPSIQYEESKSTPPQPSTSMTDTNPKQKKKKPIRSIISFDSETDTSVVHKIETNPSIVHKIKNESELEKSINILEKSIDLEKSFNFDQFDFQTSNTKIDLNQLNFSSLDNQTSSNIDREHQNACSTNNEFSSDLKASNENELKVDRMNVTNESHLKVGSSNESIDTLGSNGSGSTKKSLPRDVMSVSGYSESQSVSDLSSQIDCNTSMWSTATSNHSTDYASLRILGDSGIGELIPIASYVPYNSSDLLECDERAVDALYENGADDNEDSLSICSTSDGGSSSQAHSHQNIVRNAKWKEYESKIQELNRENELLKHQLRKYVTAVQLLKKENDSNPADNEAHLYEQKLVQLAEMHSELLELNQCLKISLNTKEAAIEKMHAELMGLRGHKPSLISLWLPCVFLGGPPNDPHHIYQVHIRVGTEEWNVYRRYSDFYKFNKTIKKSYPNKFKNFKFPPKNLIFNKGNKNDGFVEDRRQKLEIYVRNIVNNILEYETNENQINKFTIVTLIPFLNDFVPSKKNTKNNLIHSNINTIKRLSTSCINNNLQSDEDDDKSLKYNGL